MIRLSQLFHKKAPSSRTAKIIIGIIVALVLLFVLIGLMLALFGAQTGPSAPREVPGLGQLGAPCGGPSILPCMPGTVCSVPPARWAEAEGICVKDTRPAPAMKAEGERCDGENEACGWGFVCAAKEGAEGRVCVSMATSNKPFILVVIPEGIALVSGSYRAPVGAKVAVTVRALNATGGALYLKSSAASYTGVRPADKISDLVPSGTLNEYTGAFTVSEHLGAELIAVMQGVNGQEASLGVTVGAQ